MAEHLFCKQGVPGSSPGDGSSGKGDFWQDKLLVRGLSFLLGFEQIFTTQEKFQLVFKDYMEKLEKVLTYLVLVCLTGGIVFVVLGVLGFVNPQLTISAFIVSMAVLFLLKA